MIPALLLCAALAAGAPANLLRNPGFEAGGKGPAAWRTFSPRPVAHTYTWDAETARTGSRSARIDGSAGIGMWQQVVPVEPGRVYRFGADVKVERVERRDGCRLQAVFRAGDGRILEFVDLPGHARTIDWIHDFPHPMNVRAPAGAARAEVNLVLEGPGRAWFDDVLFGPAPCGRIAGTVRCGGGPVEGVRVVLWGTGLRAVSDAQGRYEIAGVPDASPRYILIASKEGYDTRTAGRIDVRAGETTRVDLALERGDDRFNVDLRVRFASLRRCEPSRPVRIPEDAVIDPARYPPEVRVYLEPHPLIDSDHPRVKAVAAEILSSLPEADRRRTRAVARAAYVWIARHIEYDVIYDPAGPRGGTNATDATSGKWQTISGEGWCWSRSFMDWLYKPSEMLRERRGICIEHSRLAAAVLRALGIPARPVMPYQAQLWFQRPSGEGGWAGLNTTGGRSAYRERGDTELGLERLAPSQVFLLPVDAGPIIHSDWSAASPVLWREVHPWRSVYPGTEEGRRRVLADMATFARTGEDPRRARGPAPRPRRGPRLPRGTRAGPPPFAREPRYVVAYSDVTLNLANLAGRRTLRLRFPFPVESEGVSFDAADRAFWTNRPGWVRRTWVSEERGPGGPKVRRWFNAEFDLGALAGRRAVRSPDAARGSEGE